jgi:hypothetical protein
MSEDAFAPVRGLTFAATRFPKLDALSVFVPDGAPADAELQTIINRTGASRWFPVAGGHRVLALYEGGPYDPGRFTLEVGAWDHEHCVVCRDEIPAMTRCYATPSGAMRILCERCHQTLAADA